MQKIIDNCPEPTFEFTGFGKAYVPSQVMCNIYSATDGFLAGTIFPELNLPYTPRHSVDIIVEEVFGNGE